MQTAGSSIWRPDRKDAPCLRLPRPSFKRNPHELRRVRASAGPHERGAEACRHHHGQPVGLGGHAPRRRDARGARRRLRRADRLRPSHPRPAGRLRQGREGRGLQGHHRRRRRGGASAGHDGGLHDAAGVRRAGPLEGAVGPGQPAFDRPDAGRRSGRHARDRRSRRGQRRAARRSRAGARRRSACRAARGLAGGAHGRGRRAPQDDRPKSEAPAR